MKKSNPIALLPIGVFLVIYLGLGLLFKYGLKINMGFYNIPIVVAFLIALLVACLQNPKLKFDDKMQAAEYLNQNLKAGDVVYLKASNAFGLKDITKYLMEQ